MQNTARIYPGIAIHWMIRFWMVLAGMVFSVPMARVTSAEKRELP